jgi:tRNA1(Val) A37 N6-methylase TrmN6
MIPSNALIAARQYLVPALQGARCVLDATAGNGNDTFFLCQQTPPECRVFAFDIQSAAIQGASDRIAQQGYGDKVCWIRDDHAKLAEYVTMPLDAAMFNLGYLPGQDHSLTTTPVSLGPALADLLERLAPGGRITLVAYPGHAPGQAEIEFLEEWLPQCPQSRFVVSRLTFINQRNNPAILYMIGETRRKPHENSSSNQGQRIGGTLGYPDAG